MLRRRQPDEDRAHRTAEVNRASPKRRVQTSAVATRRSPTRSRPPARRPTSARRRARGRRRGRREAADRHRAGHRRRAQRALAERLDHVGQVGANRVGGEEDGRHVGAGGHRQRADVERGRVGPARERRVGIAGTPTWPEATAPIAAPRKNGTITDDSANVAPSTRASAIVAASPRRAKAVPRKMIPTAAPNSGTYSVSITGPKAFGNPVQNTTSTKISHTWLASHTGPIERLSMPADARAALRAARGQVPDARAEVGAAQHRVHDQPGDSTATVRSTAISAPASRRQLALAAAGARGAAGARRRPRPAPVDDRQGRVADRDPPAPVTASVGPHHLVDDPWLAADLGRDPAGDQRDERGAGRRPRPPGRTTSTAAAAAAAQPREEVRRREQRQPGRSDHDAERVAHDGDRRPVSRGTLSRPSTVAFGSW